MKQVNAYVCEYCNDEVTITTDTEWLKEHELLCDKNPANAELPHHCYSCINYKYSYTSPFWDGYHKRWIDLRHYKCTAKNVKCTDKICLQFVPMRKWMMKWADGSGNNAQ